ncbi:MAG: lysophospholipid acyltransferase family protein [Spirochaeta sp.]|nr:lysophospholipid acyltransferase family protein [Spirochaeta sp.]
MEAPSTPRHPAATSVSRSLRIALGVTPRVLYTLLRYTLGVWLRWRFRVRIVYDRRSRALRPPYVVLANHVNFWDPFLVAMPFGPPVHFIAADGNFRGHLMRRLMVFAGTIPKAKAKNDLESIRTLQRFIAERKVVGIFPEGQRSWDGTSREVLPGTPKLIRLLGAPVVSVILRGGYLSTPRWTKRLHRGVLELSVTTVLTREEISHLSKEEVTHRIASSVTHDESQWQRATGALFFDPRRAEHIETALFLCPECGSWDALRSHGATFTCTVCGARTWHAPSGALYHVAATPPQARHHAHSYHHHRFPTVAAWNAWQLQRLREDIAAPDPAALPYRVPAADFLTGFRSRVLRPRGTVALELSREHLRLTAALALPVAELTAIHVQYAHQLEFYHRGRLYVLRMRRPEDSAYRLEETVLAIQRR